MHHEPAPAHENPPIEVGHEPNEVGIHRIFSFAVALIVLTVVVMSVLGLVMGLFAKDEKQLASSRPRLFNVADPGLYPAPNLQRDDVSDMKEYRRNEQAALAGYGWVDPKAGIAHIPIDRALAILSERGLPQVSPKPEPTPESAPAPASKK